MTASREQTTTVLQGEFRISEDPGEVMSTILGSCVAACMFDPVARIGGMNHFLLPEGSSGSSKQVKYGAYAMELLINGLLKQGARRDRLVAKLFGGATITEGLGDIGTANAEFARWFLDGEGIPCASESLGGRYARRIKFWPVSGQAKQLIVPNPSQDLTEKRSA